jgi:very-short-patch-repair endonuclease
VIERVFPDTYRLTATTSSHDQRLCAALLWAGEEAVGDRRSAATLYGLEGVRVEKPQIIVPTTIRRRSERVDIRYYEDRRSLMVRRIRGLPVTGVEATLLALARDLDGVALEVAFEDARRRRLTSLAAMQAHLDRFGMSGRTGVAALRQLLRDLDPKHPSRSTLEVLTRRLLVSHGITRFTREFPLTWMGRTYRFDFGFESRRTILETNGRRWHDDPTDYESDHEKWSVPGRHGYFLVLATCDKVTRRPHEFLAELVATLEQRPARLA